VGDKRGQLDALLDVELVLPTRDERPARPAELAPGARLGKYRLDRQLGAGGMGVVWDAHDTELDRRIALKLLARTEHADARSRLVREARAMARLRHPNVITVYDAATIDGHDAIAMELVEGETLASWLGRPRPHGEVVAKLVAAGRGLAAAHAAGLVHRDFKPHNVLVDARGRVVVTDFGLARAIDSGAAGAEPPRDSTAEASLPRHQLGALDSPLTATGTVLGTPAYMAPEQIEGRAADARADQFSFCVTLWEALAGTRPYPGDTMPAIVAALHTGAPAEPERVPRRLRSAIARGLARDPAARWPTMDALLDRLMRAWRRPRRIAIASATLVAIAAGALVAPRLVARPHAHWQPDIVDLPAFEENSDGAAISPDGSSIAFTSDREQGDVYRIYVAPLRGGDARAVTPAGESFQSPRWTRDGRALLVVKWLDNAGYHVLRQPLAGGMPTDLGPGVGVDDCGDALAIVRDDGPAGELVLRTADGQRRTLASSTSEYLLHPRCDPSGQRIVYTRSPAATPDRPAGRLYVVDRAGNDHQITEGNNADDGVFTPDGRSIVFSAITGDGAILLYEMAATGGMSHRLTFDNGPHLAPDVSRDGRTVIFDRDDTARLPIAGGDGPPRRLSGRHETMLAVVPVPDGTHVVAEKLGTSGSQIVVLDVRDGSERLLADGGHPFLSRDGTRVLFSPRAPKLASIPLAGGPVTIVAELPGTLAIGTDAADGQHLSLRRGDAAEAWRVTPDGALVRDDPADGIVFPAPSGPWRVQQTLETTTARFRFISPDGKVVRDVTGQTDRPTWLDAHRFAYCDSGAFHVIDVTTGGELATFPGPRWCEHAVLAPDGKHWYDVQTVGRDSRHLIVNFDDRSWRY